MYSVITAGSTKVFEIESSYPTKAAAAAARVAASSLISRAQYAPSRLVRSRSQFDDVSRMYALYRSHACGCWP